MMVIIAAMTMTATVINIAHIHPSRELGRAMITFHQSSRLLTAAKDNFGEWDLKAGLGKRASQSSPFVPQTKAKYLHPPESPP